MPAAAGFAAATRVSTAGACGSTATATRATTAASRPRRRGRVRGRSGSYSLRTRARGTGLIRAAPAGSVASRWRSSARRCTEPSSCRWSVRLRPGSSLGGKDFGWYQTATISGSVYEDEDGDGLRDPPEFGLSGWRVWLDRDRDGVFDPGEPSDVTAGAAARRASTRSPASSRAPRRRRCAMPRSSPSVSPGSARSPSTTDGHGCFTDVRPKSGDRLGARPRRSRHGADHPCAASARPPAARAIGRRSADRRRRRQRRRRVARRGDASRHAGWPRHRGQPAPEQRTGSRLHARAGHLHGGRQRRGRLRKVGDRRLRRRWHASSSTPASPRAARSPSTTSLRSSP